MLLLCLRAHFTLMWSPRKTHKTPRFWEKHPQAKKLKKKWWGRVRWGNMLWFIIRKPLSHNLWARGFLPEPKAIHRLDQLPVKWLDSRTLSDRRGGVHHTGYWLRWSIRTFPALRDPDWIGLNRIARLFGQGDSAYKGMNERRADGKPALANGVTGATGAGFGPLAIPSGDRKAK